MNYSNQVLNGQLFVMIVLREGEEKMVCDIFSYSVQEGTNCIGESCERCYSLNISWVTFLVLIVGCIIILTIIITILKHYEIISEKELSQNREGNKPTVP